MNFSSTVSQPNIVRLQCAGTLPDADFPDASQMDARLVFADLPGHELGLYGLHDLTIGRDDVDLTAGRGGDILPFLLPIAGVVVGTAGFDFNRDFTPRFAGDQVRR